MKTIDDHVNIDLEHKFANLTGIEGRGKPWDADHWRHGYVRDLGEALIQAGNAIQERVMHLPYNNDKGLVEGVSAQLQIYGDLIVQNGYELAKRPETERFTEDGLLLIVEGFVGMTVALLNYAEAQAK